MFIISVSFELLKAGFFFTTMVTLRHILSNSVWSVRGPVLSWIVFQVGQPLSLVGAAAGVGSRLWLIETTIQANWDVQCNSALQGNGPNCRQAVTDEAFQGYVGVWAPWKKDAFFFSLIWVLEWKALCYTHEIWFHMWDSGSAHLWLLICITVPTMPTSTQKLERGNVMWYYFLVCRL